MINGIFLHMKGDEACKRDESDWVGARAHQVSLSIHDPCPLPSRKSHFIARWTIAPLSFPLSFREHFTCKLPHPFRRDDFYKHSWNGCSCIIIFMRHFPVPLSQPASKKSLRVGGILNTISHAIYVCGMWCTEWSSTARKIYIMWMRLRLLLHSLWHTSPRLNWILFTFCF